MERKELDGSTYIPTTGQARKKKASLMRVLRDSEWMEEE